MITACFSTSEVLALLTKAAPAKLLHWAEQQGPSGPLVRALLGSVY